MSPSDAPVIDLHTHSSASDGTETPAELVESAKAAGVDVLGITDHDTVRGWAEAVAVARRVGITLVRGIEITCRDDSLSIHLLGYLTDPSHAPLMGELARARDSRATRLERMVERLAEGGIPITYPEVLAQVAPGATPGRPHIADALVASGTVHDRAEAFDRWLHDKSPYYVHHYSLDPVEAVRLVRAAGGVAVIAHPFTRTRGEVMSDELIERMAVAGLAGLEAHHRDHGPEEVARAVALARGLDLVVTGSSDYHGSGKLNRLAEFTTTPEVFGRIEELASGVTGVVRP